jgi:hypothetical protein
LTFKRSYLLLWKCFITLLVHANKSRTSVSLMMTLTKNNDDTSQWRGACVSEHKFLSLCSLKAQENECLEGSVCVALVISTDYKVDKIQIDFLFIGSREPYAVITGPRTR